MKALARKVEVMTMKNVVRNFHRFSVILHVINRCCCCLLQWRKCRSGYRRNRRLTTKHFLLTYVHHNLYFNNIIEEVKLTDNIVTIDEEFYLFESGTFGTSATNPGHLPCSSNSIREHKLTVLQFHRLSQSPVSATPSTSNLIRILYCRCNNNRSQWSGST